MKFYSERLKRLFDTEAELLAAEETDRQHKEMAKETKAKMAKEIKDYEDALSNAYEELGKAKSKVQELQVEYDKKVDEIMDPVLDTIKELQKGRTEAIKKFNEKYGVYTTTYTGNDAINEFLSMTKTLEPFWKKFYYQF